jgi:hypothetical protein
MRTSQRSVSSFRCLFSPVAFWLGSIRRSCVLLVARCMPASRLLCVIWLALAAATCFVPQAAADSGVEPPKVEEVVDGEFLGIHISDKTHDQFSRNAWLRATIRDGRRGADVFRRHQLDAISLQDGQDAKSGEAAVLIVPAARPNEMPDPPMEPVTVRRWKPQAGRVYQSEELVPLQLANPPNSEDLFRLRDMISGNRYGASVSLLRGVWITLALVAAGMALIVLAGAYRCFAYVTTRWDMLAANKKDASARQALRTARAEQEKSADS